MKKENNEKIIIFFIFAIILIGFEFGIYSFKNGWFSKEKRMQKNMEKSIITNEDGTIKLKNTIEMTNGILEPKSINIKIGELINIKNNDASPIKIIGYGWQTPYLDKGAVFTKNDFEKGVNTFYIDGRPDLICEIIVK